MTTTPSSGTAFDGCSCLITSDTAPASRPESTSTWWFTFEGTACRTASGPSSLSLADDGIVVLAGSRLMMSIYATLWRLQSPRHGDAYIGCEWVEVFAQGVPAHIGTPTPGYGYEAGDPFEAFLPPAIRIDDAAAEENLRAVVFITSLTKKGTPRSGQEYESPLLMLTGASTRRCRFKTCTTRSAMR